MDFIKDINALILSIEEDTALYFKKNVEVKSKDIYNIIHNSIVKLDLNSLNEENIKSIIRFCITKFICILSDKLNLNEIKNKDLKQLSQKKMQIASIFLFIKNVSDFEKSKVIEEIYQQSITYKKPVNLKEAFLKSDDNYKEVIRIVERGFGSLSAALQKINEKLNESQRKTFLNDIFSRREEAINILEKKAEVESEFIDKLIRAFYCNINKGLGKLVEHLFINTLKENGYTLKYESGSEYSEQATEKYIKNLRGSFKIISQYKQFINLNIENFNTLEDVYKELNIENPTIAQEEENYDDLLLSIDKFVDEAFNTNSNKQFFIKSFNEFIDKITKIKDLSSNNFNYILVEDSKFVDNKSTNQSTVLSHLKDAKKIIKIKPTKNIILPSSQSEIFDLYLECEVEYLRNDNTITTSTISKCIAIDVKFYNSTELQVSEDFINITEPTKGIEVTTTDPSNIHIIAPDSIIVSMFKINCRFGRLFKIKNQSINPTRFKKQKKQNFRKKLYESLHKISQGKKIQLSCDYGYRSITDFLLNKKVINIKDSVTLQENDLITITSKISSYDKNILIANLLNYVKVNSDTYFLQIFTLSELFNAFIKETSYKDEKNEKTYKRDYKTMVRAYHRESENKHVKTIKEHKAPYETKYNIIKNSTILRALLDYLTSNNSNNFSEDDFKSYTKSKRKRILLSLNNTSNITYENLKVKLKSISETDIENIVNICVDITEFYIISDTKTSNIEVFLEQQNMQGLIKVFKNNYSFSKYKYRRNIQKNYSNTTEYMNDIKKFLNNVKDNSNSEEIKLLDTDISVNP